LLYIVFVGKFANLFLTTTGQIYSKLQLILNVFYR